MCPEMRKRLRFMTAPPEDAPSCDAKTGSDFFYGQDFVVGHWSVQLKLRHLGAGRPSLPPACGHRRRAVARLLGRLHVGLLASAFKLWKINREDEANDQELLQFGGNVGAWKRAAP
jgi:hypothetical protein